MQKENGLKVRSWSDVTAVATLLAMFLAVVAWGLKLETELNSLRDQYIQLRNDQKQTELEVKVHEKAGAHVRADERIGSLERFRARYQRENGK